MLKRLYTRTSFSVPNSCEGSRNTSPVQGSHSMSALGAPARDSASLSPSGSQVGPRFGRKPYSSSFSSARDIERMLNVGEKMSNGSPFLARAARYSDTRSPLPPRVNLTQNGEEHKERQRSKSWDASKIRSSRVSLTGSTCVNDNNKETVDEFQDAELRTLIHNTLDTHLNHVDYDHNLSSDRCKLLTKILESSTRSRLPADKEYKVAALIFMGEVLDDGIKIATQCSWIPQVDKFAMTTYQVGSLFVSAIVLASEIGDATTDSDTSDGESF